MGVWLRKATPQLSGYTGGENCLDLEKLLANSDVTGRHLEAVKEWLCSRCHTEPKGT